MVFVADSQSDDEEQKTPSQGPVSIGTTGGTRLAPSAGVVSGPASTSLTGTGGATPKPGAGGSFASLDKYVTANQGNAAPIANNVTTNANTQYNSLNQGNTSALNNVSNQVNNGYTKEDNALIAQEEANPISFSGGTTPSAQGTLNPIAIAAPGSNFGTTGASPVANNGASNVAAFQKQLNDTYTGPANAESDSGVQAAQAADNAAIANGQTLTSTDAGRAQLLQQNERDNNAGVTALNGAVLSESPTALGQVEHAYDPFSNLVTNLNTGTANIDTSIGQAQNEAQQASANAAGALNGQLTGLNTQIGNENTAAYNTANTDYQNLLSALNSAGPVDQSLLDAVNKAHAVGAVAGGDANANAALSAAMAASPGANALTPAQMSELGITPAQLGQLESEEKNLETSKFVTSGNGGNGSAWTTATEAPLTQWLSGAAPTQANFTGATSQDVALGNALNTIGGQNVFSAPSTGPAYVAPTFNINGALSALQGDVAQNNLTTQQQADQVAATQEAAHDASKNGSFGSKILSTLQSAAPFIANAPLALAQKTIQPAQQFVSKAGI